MDDFLKKYELQQISGSLAEHHINTHCLQWLDMDHDFAILAQELALNATQAIKLRAMTHELQHTRHLENSQPTADKLQQTIHCQFDELMQKLQSTKHDLLLEVQRWNSSSNVRAKQSTQKNVPATASNDLNPFSSDMFQDALEIAEDDETQQQQQIQLECVEHRQHFESKSDKYHPKQLLDVYDDGKYYSDTVGNFGKHEHDWIVFRSVHEDEFFLPRYLEIKNHNNEYAVKQIRVYIGNNSKEWFELHTNPLILSNKIQFVQKLDLRLNEIVNKDFILDKQLNFYKIALIGNYGASHTDKAKFCFHYFGLFGMLLCSIDCQHKLESVKTHLLTA